MVCGIRLAEAGKRCAIVSQGQSALHFSSGSFDLLSRLPDGTTVNDPMAGIVELEKMAPEHPYSVHFVRNMPVRYRRCYVRPVLPWRGIAAGTIIGSPRWARQRRLG